MFCKTQTGNIESKSPVKHYIHWHANHVTAM